MPISLQPKLLRILEDGRARRLGGSKEVQFDVRVIAATNRSPAQAIRDGMLREDLFYRLNVFEVTLPALNERSEDIRSARPALCGRVRAQAPDERGRRWRRGGRAARVASRGRETSESCAM